MKQDFGGKKPLCLSLKMVEEEKEYSRNTWTNLRLQKNAAKKEKRNKGRNLTKESMESLFKEKKELLLLGGCVFNNT